MTNEGNRFFEEGKRRVQEKQQEQATRAQIQRANNRGCVSALIICTFMVCVTVLFVVWLVYG